MRYVYIIRKHPRHPYMGRVDAFSEYYSVVGCFDRKTDASARCASLNERALYFKYVVARIGVKQC